MMWPDVMTQEEVQARLDALKKLREPFPEHQISKLPKPTCKKEEYDKLPRGACDVCGGYHATSKTIHLDYVGHAALTDRLLDVDPLWSWEPFALEDGLPKFDDKGGLWIRLTICGITRPGYGQAAEKSWSDPGAREKEVIGDALRNAAMRFGAALELWHKGQLHVEEEKEEESPFSKLPEDLQTYMRDIQSVIEQCHLKEDGEGMMEAFQTAGFENEQLEVFWGLLDSKVRSTIKAGQSLQKADSPDALKSAWVAVPKHAQKTLESLKDKRKQELV